MTDKEIYNIYERAMKQSLRPRDFPEVKKVIDEAIKSQGSAINDVIAARKRQIEYHNYSTERDDKYIDCELAAASACYMAGSHRIRYMDALIYPWPVATFNVPTECSNAAYRKTLLKGIALGLAEVERIDRIVIDDEVELCPS